jgi:hypothetical protein
VEVMEVMEVAETVGAEMVE